MQKGVYQLLPRLSIIHLFLLIASVSWAGENIHVAEIEGYTIEVRIIEDIRDVSVIRAECLIPRPIKLVWAVLSDYDHLEDLIPVVHDSRLVYDEQGNRTLIQEGRAGFFVFNKDFTVTFDVREVPMSYIGFNAVEGDFRRFNGSWQLQERQEGTWVSHKVEIEPGFYAPGWVIRRMARGLMVETIDGVLAKCISLEVSE